MRMSSSIWYRLFLLFLIVFVFAFGCLCCNSTKICLTYTRPYACSEALACVFIGGAVVTAPVAGVVVGDVFDPSSAMIDHILDVSKLFLKKVIPK